MANLPTFITTIVLPTPHLIYFLFLQYIIFYSPFITFNCLYTGWRLQCHFFLYDPLLPPFFCPKRHRRVLLSNSGHIRTNSLFPFWLPLNHRSHIYSFDPIPLLLNSPPLSFFDHQSKFQFPTLSPLFLSS